MSADLGTWSRAQAAVLVKVLKRAGVEPVTTPGPDGASVAVRVPEDQADRANAAIAAEMDTIARAARAERSRAEARNVRSLDAARRARGRRGRAGTDGPPLVTERLRRLGPFLGLLVAALMVATLVPGALRFPTLVVTVLVVVYLVGRGRPGG